MNGLTINLKKYSSDSSSVRYSIIVSFLEKFGSDSEKSHSCMMATLSLI